MADTKSKYRAGRGFDARQTKSGKIVPGYASYGFSSFYQGRPELSGGGGGWDRNWLTGGRPDVNRGHGPLVNPLFPNARKAVKDERTRLKDKKEAKLAGQRDYRDPSPSREYSSNDDISGFATDPRPRAGTQFDHYGGAVMQGPSGMPTTGVSTWPAPPRTAFNEPGDTLPWSRKPSTGAVSFT